MIKLERTNVMNLENAIRGARNPMNSWGRMDSYYSDEASEYMNPFFVLGPNDLDLAKRLCKAGSDHRKFIRQIFVSVDITAPMYWWKEYDTYKVGTTANSTSTMHKIHTKPFDRDDFSHEYMSETTLLTLDLIINQLELLRNEFNATKNKDTWYSIIQLLPSSYNQTRTCTMTYENLFNMVNARKNHKLKEWHEFCDWAMKLPYLQEFMAKDK